MSSHHEWIVNVVTLSYHEKMMMKEMEGRMLKDTLVAEHTSWSTKESKGTLVCDHHSRFEIIEYSLSPRYVEVKRKEFLRRHSTLSISSGLTLPHHQEVHVSSVRSCNVMSGHMPHLMDNGVTYVSKIHCKWKSKWHVWNTKSHVKLKIHRKSNNCEGIRRVTRKVKQPPQCYIYSLIIRARDFFTLAPLVRYQKDKLVILRRNVMKPAQEKIEKIDQRLRI